MDVFGFYVTFYKKIKNEEWERQRVLNFVSPDSISEVISNECIEKGNTSITKIEPPELTNSGYSYEATIERWYTNRGEHNKLINNKLIIDLKAVINLSCSPLDTIDWDSLRY